MWPCDLGECCLVCCNVCCREAPLGLEYCQFITNRWVSVCQHVTESLKQGCQAVLSQHHLKDTGARLIQCLQLCVRGTHAIVLVGITCGHRPQPHDVPAGD